MRNKKILITAGPTWVPIDSVRVISNIATGETGILLSEKLQKAGAKVTLLLGPADSCCLNKKIKLMRFKFFDELRNLVKKELSAGRYDIIIHSAAVSDLKPDNATAGKFKSDKPYNLKLVPLPKVIRDIRRLADKAKLVMFKLESGVSDGILITRAQAARDAIGADFVVANRLNPYRAYIIGKEGKTVFAKNKSTMVRKLLEVMRLTPNT